MDHHLNDDAPTAYDYPLIIRQLLHTTPILGRGNEIVFGDLHRYDYPAFLERLGLLAGGLASLEGRGYRYRRSDLS